MGRFFLLSFSCTEYDITEEFGKRYNEIDEKSGRGQRNNHEHLRLFKGHSEDHMHHVSTVEVTGDGAYLLSGSYDKCIILWNIGKSKLLIKLDTGSKVESIAIVPGSDEDPLRFVSGHDDNTAKLWGIDLETEGEESGLVLLHIYKGHYGIVKKGEKVREAKRRPTTSRTPPLSHAEMS